MKKFLLLSGIILASHASTLHAATIGGLDGSFGNGFTAGVASITSPSPNNDNTAAASTNKFFINVAFSAVNLGDLVINAITSGGVSEYNTGGTGVFRVTNNTGLSWDRFQIALGFGHIAADGLTDSFVLSNTSDFIDFDAPDRDPAPTATTAGFGSLFHGSNLLDFESGDLADGESADFDFSFDLPDFNEFIPDFAETNTGYQFSLRLIPFESPNQPTTGTEIPEPSTVALMGLGLLGFLGLRARGNK